jgi:hypothetical protein
MTANQSDDLNKITLPSASEKTQVEEELIRRYLGVEEDFNVNEPQTNVSGSCPGFLKTLFLAALLTIIFGAFIVSGVKVAYFQNPWANQVVIFACFFFVVSIVLMFHK